MYNKNIPYNEYTIERVLSEPPHSLLPSNMPFESLEDLIYLHVKDISKIYQICIVLEMVNQNNVHMVISEKRLDALVNVFMSHVLAEMNRREFEIKEEPATLDTIFNDLELYLSKEK